MSRQVSYHLLLVGSIDEGTEINQTDTTLDKGENVLDKRGPLRINPAEHGRFHSVSGTGMIEAFETLAD